MALYRGPGGAGDATVDATNNSALASASADEAATSATSAASSATAAANSATAADTSADAAANSASNAAGSATTATTAATNASTYASNASDSADEAAASASDAADSATAAASSASSAATYADTASTQATNAASSASSASTSASTATAAKDAALAALDSFDDRYLGAKTSDPTVDNDGNTLEPGALYYNTTDDVMKVYEGSAWVAAYASVSGALLIANNLSDIASASAARTNLGLGTVATTDASAYATAAQGATADSALQSSAVGVSVQAYDADTTKNDVANTFTANQIVSVTDNTNAALRITQLGTGNALLVEDSSNPDSSPFVIDATGNTAVGSEIVATALSGSTPKFSVNGTSLATATQATTNWGNSVTSPVCVLSKSRGGATGVHTIVQSGDNLGTVAGLGSDGTNFVQSARIDFFVDGTPGTNDMPGRLVFSTTADGALSPTERMRIDSLGNVGIGGSTTNYQKLGINGTLPVSSNISEAVSVRGDFPAASSGVDAFLSRPTTSGAVSTLRHFRANPGTFTGAVTSQYGYVAESSLTGATNNYGFYGNIASGTGRYNFYASGTAANYFAGNVGIGTSSPATKLEVAADNTAGTALNIIRITDLDTSAGTNQPVGRLEFYSNDPSGPGVGVRGALAVNSENSIGSGSYLTLSTSGAAGNDVERMRIDSAGNVGIGTGIPSSKLTVQGSTGNGIVYTDTTVSAYMGTSGSALAEYGTLTNHPMRWLTNGSERARIDSSGSLLVGTTTSWGGTATISSASAAGSQAMTVVKSAVAANTANNYYMQFNGSASADGYINTNGSSVLTLTDASDVRLKENIVDATYGMNTIMALRPVEYSWIGDDRRVKGFIAQEVKDVLPESVSIKDNSETGGLEDMHLLEMQTMIPVLVKAVQEQQAIIESLKARLDAANL